MPSFTVQLRMLDIHDQHMSHGSRSLHFTDHSRQTRFDLTQALAQAWTDCRRANQQIYENRQNSRPSGLFAGVRNDLATISRQLDRVISHMEGRPPQTAPRDPEYGIDFVIQPDQDPSKALGMLIPVNRSEPDPSATFRMAREVLVESLGVDLLEL